MFCKEVYPRVREHRELKTHQQRVVSHFSAETLRWTRSAFDVRVYEAAAPFDRRDRGNRVQSSGVEAHPDCCAQRRPSQSQNSAQVSPNPGSRVTKPRSSVFANWRDLPTWRSC